MQPLTETTPSAPSSWHAEISLAELKRVLERCSADPAYSERLKNEPQAAMAEYGFEWDPAAVRELWDPSYRDQRPLPPIVLAYRDYILSKYALRDEMRSGSSAHHPVYQKWRERQKARVFLDLGEARSDSIVHAPMCFELNKGCSVGCWFCGISAPKLSDIWPYTPQNAHLWVEVLETMSQIVGPLARWGFCYWATDPLDNPDYEKFCTDYHAVLGTFPQTTTALSLRDPERVRQLLRLSQEKGCPINRFSILTLKNFLAVQREYSAEELLCVECIPQNAESPLQMANAGKAGEKAERTNKAGQRAVSEVSGTIACVSGFLFNMVERSIKLITPCSSNADWPLGYWVLGEATFADAHELGREVHRLLGTLTSSVTQLPKVRLARFLEGRVTDEGLEFRALYASVKMKGGARDYLQFLCTMLEAGEHTAQEVALLAFYTCGVPCEETLRLLERLFDLGAMDEDPAS